MPTSHSPTRYPTPLAIACCLLPTMVFYGAARMRAPFEPFVLLFAAAGFEDARRRLRIRTRGLRVVEGRRAR